MGFPPHERGAPMSARTWQRRRGLGLWMATALVVGNMIGSGVFLLPSSLAAYGGISIVAWLLTTAGAVLLALVFARLGRAYPQTGGPSAYSAAAQLMLLVTDRARFSGRRLARDALVALGAFGYSLWAIAGAGYEVVFKGFLLLLAGIPVYVGMRWWQKRSAPGLES